MSKAALLIGALNAGFLRDLIEADKSKVVEIKRRPSDPIDYVDSFYSVQTVNTGRNKLKKIIREQKAIQRRRLREIKRQNKGR